MKVKQTHCVDDRHGEEEGDLSCVRSIKEGMMVERGRSGGEHDDGEEVEENMIMGCGGEEVEVVMR